MPNPAPVDARPLTLQVTEEAPAAWTWCLRHPDGAVLAHAPGTTWPTRAEATAAATGVVAILRVREVEVVYPPRVAPPAAAPAPKPEAAKPPPEPADDRAKPSGRRSSR